MTNVARPPAGCPRSDIDPWSDEVLADPYPTYRALRALGPVVWLDRYAVAALPRFAASRAALADWQSYSSASGVAIAESSNASMGKGILTSDPPLHSENRRLMASELSTKALAGDAEDVSRRADDLVAALVARGRFDGVEDVARPYSLDVVASLLGLPCDGRERELPQLAESSFNLIGPVNERQAAGFDALRHLVRYGNAVVAEGALRADSRGARHVAAGRPGDITNYTWPGIDTTVNGIASALWLFARFPQQWERVRNNRALIPSAWNEALRLHAPVQNFSRLTTRAVAIEGVTLPAETRVLMMFGSANRDARHYADPDNFDVARNPVDQLAFGHGVHLCVGANLARLEAHALFDALARRVAAFRLAGDVRWTINNAIHGPATLPLEITPAGS